MQFPSKTRAIRIGGFALIELLVVIAIMALMMGLLLVALSRWRDLGRRVVCQSNQHQIYIAMQNYLVDQEALPRLTRQIDARPPFETHDDLKVPWYLAPAIYHINAPNNEVPSEFVNFGRLWVLGLLDTIKVFYCPAQTHPDFRFRTPTNPWPEEAAQRLDDEAEFKIWNDVFASYTRRLGLSYIHFDDVDPGTAIVADVNMFPSYARTNHSAAGFNVLASDGSTAWTSDQWFYRDDPAFEDFDFYDAVRHCLEGFERLDR